eukprot:TRINITY_DN7565_c0_g1_i10.p2 TRINITY_DN7565_c0_g1~~TRINITY_DN7565_c0_g1_i10.p2  ORF type:complete len:155 (-),score=20.01 TRINITY_DN7565_c0_g1_i10:350-814(-)
MMVCSLNMCQSYNRFQKIRFFQRTHFGRVRKNQNYRIGLLIKAQQQQPSSTEKQVEDAAINAEQQEKSVNQDDEVLSDEELERLAALKQLKEQRKERSKNILQGALDETRLIEWPGPGSAITNTFLVIGIVAGTSVMLFTINTLLVEISNIFYG